MEKSFWKKPVLLLTYGLLLFFVLYRFSEVADAAGAVLHILTPFIFGGALAFALNIPMSFFERKLFGRGEKAKPNKLKRPASLILTIVIAAAVIYFVIFMVVPELVHTVQMIAEQIPESVAAFQSWLDSLDVDWDLVQNNVLNEALDWKKLSEKAASLAQGILPSIFTSAYSVVSSTVGLVVNFVIGFIFAIYILTSKEKLAAQARRFLYAFLGEKKAERTLYVCRLSNKTFRNFVTGQCVEAVILGTMFIITMSVLGLPYATLIGIVIMVTALIPIVGAFVGCVIGIFLILIVNPVQAVEFLVLFLVLQQVEGNLIYPHVVGNSVGLPSIWVLVSVTVGGGLMGIAGMLLFIPLVSVIYTLVREQMYEKLKEKQIPPEKWKSEGEKDSVEKTECSKT